MIDPKLRTASCRQKNHYSTQELAEVARQRLQAKHGWLLNIYQCDQCDEFHLARQKANGKPIPIVGFPTRMELSLTFGAGAWRATRSRPVRGR